MKSKYANVAHLHTHVLNTTNRDEMLKLHENAWSPSCTGLTVGGNSREDSQKSVKWK